MKLWGQGVERGHLNDNVPHGLMFLNTWSVPGSGIWGGLGDDSTFQEEVLPQHGH